MCGALFWPGLPPLALNVETGKINAGMCGAAYAGTYCAAAAAGKTMGSEKCRVLVDHGLKVLIEASTLSGC